MHRDPPPFFKHGPSPLARVTFFGLLSLALLVSDAHFKYLDGIRRVVAVALYPLQLAATAPTAAYRRMSDFFTTQSRLTRENERLREERLATAPELQRMALLEAENDHLRRLLDAKQRHPGTAVMAELLYAGRDPFARKIIVDRGTRHGVRAGQAVVDAGGVIGQVTRTADLTSEVTLVTDKDHAVPVEVLRTGMRAVAFGTGRGEAMELRYIPVSADMQTGDVLVTSGIDGIYPRGLPVATVVSVERRAELAFARVACAPNAGVDRHRQYLVLSEPPAREPGKPVAQAGPGSGKAATTP